ncbi:MAG: GtrA family protein [Pseudonocardiales bacterium]|nr:GtrA family protein [Pseudonocardiales bacterium]
MQTRALVAGARRWLASLAGVLGTGTAPVSGGFMSQLGRFVMVGAFSALVDYGIYSALLLVDTPVHLAKALSFIAGTTTAYLLNRRFTFDSTGGAGRFAGFVVLYATTFAANVGVNAAALSLLPDMPLRITLAWVIAQGTATAINFVMLRTVVFRT